MKAKYLVGIVVATVAMPVLADNWFKKVERGTASRLDDLTRNISDEIKKSGKKVERGFDSLDDAVKEDFREIVDSVKTTKSEATEELRNAERRFVNRNKDTLERVESDLQILGDSAETEAKGTIDLIEARTADQTRRLEDVHGRYTSEQAKARSEESRRNEGDVIVMPLRDSGGSVVGYVYAPMDQLSSESFHVIDLRTGLLREVPAKTVKLRLFEEGEVVVGKSFANQILQDLEWMSERATQADKDRLAQAQFDFVQSLKKPSERDIATQASDEDLLIEEPIRSGASPLPESHR